MVTTTLESLGASILYGMAGGAAYGLVYFAKNRETTTTNKETFKLRKFGATVLFGALVGAINAATGQPITYESIQVTIGANSGVVMLLQSLLQAAYRWTNNRYGWFSGAQGDAPQQP